MDWEYLENEIVDKIVWEINQGKQFFSVIQEVCHQYSLEFPQYSNHILELKDSMGSLPLSKKTKKIN